MKRLEAGYRPPLSMDLHRHARQARSRVIAAGLGRLAMAMLVPFRARGG